MAFYQNSLNAPSRAQAKPWEGEIWREFRPWNTLSSGLRFRSKTMQLYSYAWV